MKKIMFVLVLMGLSACSSNKVRELNTEIDAKGTSSLGTIGLIDNEAVIQDKERADDFLRRTQWHNYELESNVLHEQALIKWCYQDLADPRLGGDGNLADMPKGPMKPAAKVKEELGLDNDDLVVVRTEDFKERLELERKFQASLEALLASASETREKCELKMGRARLKAGLPSKRIQGKVTITPEGKIDQVLQKNENSLDDAFEIKPEAKPLSLPVEVKEVVQESALE